MRFFHRKLLQLTKNIVVVIKDEQSPVSCISYSDADCVPILPPPPSHHSISPLVILTFCALGVAFVFICYLTLCARYRRHLTNSRTNLDETRQDFVVDEDQGLVIDHPIWLIHTLGLEQSVLDSIDVFKYKRAERLIEGTECSVCLNEFQDDENLRLLPNCSHSFHVPCIDTWLRSHKNCPLCRAPIVCNNAQVRTVDLNSNELGSSSEENVEETSEEMRDGVQNVEEDNISEILQKNSRHFGESNSGVRVKSDLADYRGKVEEELQPVRRSISMDSSSASMIYLAVTNINVPVMEQPIVHDKKQNAMKSNEGHKGSSSSIYKRAMKSYSFGRSSRKLSISMRRSYSYSSNGKCSQPSDGKSLDSIIVSED